jgi:F-type H+-transporting ATPase subunit alpha
MKQKQFSPLSVAEMAISLFAADKGYLDDVAVDKIVNFEQELQSFMNNQHKDLLDKVNERGDYNEEIEKAYAAALDDFKANHFIASK